MYKIIFFDGNIELNSVEKLKKIIRTDYDQYKEGLQRVIVKSNESGRLKGDDDYIDKTTQKALEQFNRLNWIDLEGDLFETRASFHRILSLYGDTITNIDSIIKSYQ